MNFYNTHQILSSLLFRERANKEEKQRNTYNRFVSITTIGFSSGTRSSTLE